MAKGCAVLKDMGPHRGASLDLGRASLLSSEAAPKEMRVGARVAGVMQKGNSYSSSSITA